MFSIVVFSESNEVDVIPDKWLLDDHSAYWPNVKAHDLFKLRQMQASPSGTWDIYEIRVLCKEGNYCILTKFLREFVLL